MPRDKLPDDLGFDPKRILEMLVAHQVRFVVIGGMAAIFHASPFATFDLDICPSPDEDNLRRLSDALEELQAKMRFTDEPEPIKVDFSPRTLMSAPFFNLETRWGRLDIVHRPAATDGFKDLIRGAEQIRLGDLEILVASRTDVLLSKEALYRDKDIPTIRLFQELEERDLSSDT